MDSDQSPGYVPIWLVVWKIFHFSHILGIIIPIDVQIFFRGVETTKQPLRWLFSSGIFQLHSIPIPGSPWFLWRRVSEVLKRNRDRIQFRGHIFKDREVEWNIVKTPSIYYVFLFGMFWWLLFLPSGNFAHRNEHGHWNREFSHENSMVNFHSYVKLPEGNMCSSTCSIL